MPSSNMAKQVLLNLRHRGAEGGDESTGDGAGILIQIPHEFFQPRPAGRALACLIPAGTAWRWSFCPKAPTANSPSSARTY